MNSWLEDPFKSVIGGTIILVAVGASLLLGIAAVDLFV